MLLLLLLLSTRRKVGIFLHNLINCSPLWRCFEIIMDIDTIRTLSSGITMFSGHCNFNENVEYASHCCWSWESDFEQVEISQAQRGHWDKVQRTRSQLFFVPMCSPEGHQTFETLKSKQRGLLNFSLHQVEGNREINLCRSFLIFEVPNFHSSWQHATTLWLPPQWCLLKEKLSPYDFQQFNISSCSNVFLSIPCWYTPYKAWKLRETFRKITNNGAPHRRETWIRCIFMTLLACSSGVSSGAPMFLLAKTPCWNSRREVKML